MTDRETSTADPASPAESPESAPPVDGPTPASDPPASGSDRPATGLDPATLADDPAVDYAERAYPHSDADHCEADARGRAVVGLTRDDGAVLLRVNEDAGQAILPNDTVAPDERFRAVARAAAEDGANAPVAIEDPVAVRRVEHYATDDPDAVGDPEAFEPAGADPHAVTHHLVFAASLAGAHEEDGHAPNEPTTTEDEARPTEDEPTTTENEPTTTEDEASTIEGDGTAVPTRADDEAAWTVGWYRESPVDVTDETGDAIDDLRRFLD